MEMRYPVHPDQVKRMTTDELRANFHIGDLFEPDQLNLVYSHIDRVIIGGAVPSNKSVVLAADRHDLAADYFLERREVGIINIGGEGRITVDGEFFTLAKRDGLYVGQGKREMVFSSMDTSRPAQFYLLVNLQRHGHRQLYLHLGYGRRKSRLCRYGSGADGVATIAIPPGNGSDKACLINPR